MIADTLQPQGNLNSGNDAVSLSKRLKDKATTFLSSSSSSASASTSQATSALKLIVDSTKSVARKGKSHIRAKSESSSNRPSLLRPSSSHDDSDIGIKGDLSSPTPNESNLRPKRSFRHEQYPRSPIMEHPDEDHTSSDNPTNTYAGAADVDDIKVPALLQQGTPMLKVSAKKIKTRVFRLDADLGQILWESKKYGKLSIENIKEIRSGSETRYYREQFKIAASFEEQWLTLIYISPEGKYKTLHVVAFTADVFRMWNSTVRRLHSLRKDLMSGLGDMKRRALVWEKQFWKGADSSGDQKLEFEEVVEMCRRLNINSPREDLLNRFMEADSKMRGFLDFADFRRFVALLKARPDINDIFEMIIAESSKDEHGAFTFAVFEKFMHNHQKCTMRREGLIKIFNKYVSRSRASSIDTAEGRAIAQTPGNGVGKEELPPPEPVASDEASDAAGSTNDDLQRYNEKIPTSSAMPNATPPSFHQGSELPNYPLAGAPLDAVSLSAVWTLESFTSFLLSSDNSPFQDASFTDAHGGYGATHATKIWQDMNRPISEYFISSSHNTYLVGHQLVGDSTVEGYIRALLHGCRSVELDIWDGDDEPAIYHGRTLTSKVSLSDVCRAIAKYAFIASPYPLIISAEVHCGVDQQDKIASIMSREFGDMLVKSRIDGDENGEIKELPSPEMLRHRILLKAKNLQAVQSVEGPSSLSLNEPDSSTTTHTEASSTDASNSDIEPIKEIKQELARARSLVDRVRGKIVSNLSSISDESSNTDVPAAPSQGAASPSLPSPLIILGLPDDGSARNFPETSRRASRGSNAERAKPKMSMALAALIVYTVGVKCRGFNKKERYAVEHVFSLSERMANKVVKESMSDLVKHNRTHVTRVYPSGTRLSSSNYEPHRYWASGTQLVAINWQTFDLGYMMNYAMFQRNGRSGYVLKPAALRLKDKELLNKRTKHFLDVTIISAQQLPRVRDEEGRDKDPKHTIDPYVEVSIHIPDWTHSPFLPDDTPPSLYSPPSNTSPSSARTVSVSTTIVKNNGFNPVWQECMSLPFDCLGDMMDLIFVKFQVKDEHDNKDLAVHCVPLGSLQPGFRHLPLHDKQLSQFLFSTLFVETHIRDVSK